MGRSCCRCLFLLFLAVVATTARGRVVLSMFLPLCGSLNRFHKPYVSNERESVACVCFGICEAQADLAQESDLRGGLGGKRLLPFPSRSRHPRWLLVFCSMASCCSPRNNAFSSCTFCGRPTTSRSYFFPWKSRFFSVFGTRVRTYVTTALVLTRFRHTYVGSLRYTPYRREPIFPFSSLPRRSYLPLIFLIHRCGCVRPLTNPAL